MQREHVLMQKEGVRCKRDGVAKREVSRVLQREGCCGTEV